MARSISSACRIFATELLRIATPLLLTLAALAAVEPAPVAAEQSAGEEPAIVPAPVAAEQSAGEEPAAAPAEPFLDDAYFADDGPVRTAGGQPDIGAAIGDLVVGLVVVIGLAVAAGWFVRRSGARKRLLGGSTRHMVLLETMPLGLKRAVSLVRIGDRAVLVGQSEQGLANLGSLPWGQVTGTGHTGDDDEEPTDVASWGRLLNPRADALADHAEREEAVHRRSDDVELPTIGAEYAPTVDPDTTVAEDQAREREAPTDRIARFRERLRRVTEGLA